MNEPTLLELIREYGRTMESVGIDSTHRPHLENEGRIRGERLYDEIERRVGETMRQLREIEG